MFLGTEHAMVHRVQCKPHEINKNLFFPSTQRVFIATVLRTPKFISVECFDIQTNDFPHQAFLLRVRITPDAQKRTNPSIPTVPAAPNMRRPLYRKCSWFLYRMHKFLSFVAGEKCHFIGDFDRIFSVRLSFCVISGGCG